MALKLYNTLTRTKEPFEPIHPGKVGMYLCGPTVYKPSHIGHAVGPIIFDAFKRYLTFLGYEVTWVVNITDVEDKLIAEAEVQGCTVAELASRIMQNYLDGMKGLGIAIGKGGIDVMPKASEHIDDIIRYIEALIDKGAAYPLDGDVYFDITADDDYGKLSNRSTESQEGQRDLKGGAKRHPGDFALWKAAKPEEPDAVKYKSPWGPGRPGWHIECSVMSMRYLGETFDIHGGGLDLIFPHHENEIAQSETATGKPFAIFWMHNGLTRFNTKKVSKSDPEMQAALAKMTLSNLLQEYPGELLRFFVLSTHYRRPIEFSPEELESKRKALSTFCRLFDRVERITKQSPYEDVPAVKPMSEDAHHGMPKSSDPSAEGREFLLALEDDFNTAAAIAALFEMASAINRTIDDRGLESNVDAEQDKAHLLSQARQLIAYGRLLGLFVKPPAEALADQDKLVDKVMQVLIEVRTLCRKNKDFATADLIRDRLNEAGLILEDRPDGTGWSIRA